MNLNNNNRFNVTVNSTSLDTTEEIVHFSDQTSQWDYVVDSSPDSTFGQADSGDDTLQNFFSRPLQTRSYNWSVGSTFHVNFNPWTDFFENPRTVNRISNYKNLRCKLKVRLMINGNGFHYGRAIAAYNPLHVDDDFTQFRAGIDQDKIAASQRPHVYLDPTNSQGGTLTLPFFWPSNALDIPGAAWQLMGDMTISSFGTLKHANGATDNVSIAVFVWAEDVTLSIPTIADAGGLVPQAGEDEYPDGPVSGPAATLSRVANRLTDIPVLGPYAKATELAASSVAAIARLFGFSRPVHTCGASPFVPRVYGSMANSNVVDGSEKLTLDVKQELCVDPRTVGLDAEDQMTISSIAMRESYLTSFTWATSAAVDTLLWNAEINPMIWDVNGDELHLPACALAVLPFQFWRGSMQYRFQIIASSFHKGRLLISYDPSESGAETNTNYSYIVDLAKERDFTIKVGWGQSVPWLSHTTPGVDSPPFSIAPLPIWSLYEANGLIQVSVINKLTTPNSTTNNDIRINVFVSAGDDFEVVAPTSVPLGAMNYFPESGAAAPAAPPPPVEGGPVETEPALEPQAGEEDTGAINQPDSDLTTRESEPMKTEANYEVAPTMSPRDQALNVFFGDPVVSFRSCLKRYNYHSSTFIDNTLPNYHSEYEPNFPWYRGWAPSAIDLCESPAPSTPFNFCKMTLLNLLTPCYKGYRGGMRWKFMRSFDSNNEHTFMYAMRIPFSNAGYQRTETNLLDVTASDSERASQFVELIDNQWDGSAWQTPQINNVLEVEFPYHNPTRFSPAQDADVTGPTIFPDYHRFACIADIVSSDPASINKFVSVGEDFSLFFFTGAPILYYQKQSDDPVPSP